MKTKTRVYTLCVLAILVALGTWLAPSTARAADSSSTAQMHRLYNPNSGEHFYTASTGEKNAVVAAGWRYEGIGWVAPTKSNVPVYRLYNPNAGDHHYTVSVAERDMLTAVGWRYEGIGWYSSETKAVALYRQYNPNARAGAHNYTVNKAENDMLVRVGWQEEGIGWYGVKLSSGKTYTVTFKDGYDGRSIKVEQVQAGKSAHAPTPPTHLLREFLGWDVSFDNVQSNITVTAEYYIPNKVLNDWTWKELSAISEEIAAAKTEEAGIEVAKAYHLLADDGSTIGDTKTIKVKVGTKPNGTAEEVEVGVHIIGINHDSTQTGVLRGLTFQFADCPTGQYMNFNGSNQGGWEKTYMRSWLNKDFIATLPADLQSAIVPVIKMTNNTGHTSSTSAVTKTNDKLWLLSSVEVGGSFEQYPDSNYMAIRAAEGTQYKRFADDGVGVAHGNRYYQSLTKKACLSWTDFDGSIQEADNYCAWYLRSPYLGTTDSFDAAGGVGWFGADWCSDSVAGVAPGFCI